jgi:hypothetical protein
MAPAQRNHPHAQGSFGEDAASVGSKVEEATSAVGSKIRDLGSTIREHTPTEGMFGKTSAAVADSLESGGRYLQEHGLNGIGEDVATLIRRNPIPALLVGCGVGFLLARVIRS